ncbi:MAG TPA: hypothetical protein DCM71_28015 [Runella sp.]|nr:hypothetical protein [Runella sp.]
MYPTDRKNIERLDQLIDENILNGNYSIDDICLQLGMSRSQLFRLVKEETDLSTSRYIRRRRLRKGRELIETTDRKIAEIAYQIGVDSPQTFTKYFTEEFGVSPTEYRKNREKEPPTTPLYEKEEAVQVVDQQFVKEKVLAVNKPTKYKYVALALLLIVLTVVGFWIIKRGGAFSESENSIAVLPFKSNGNPEAALLSEGVTEQLHASLATLRHLKVISKNSSELFRGSQKTVPQIASELHVAYVLGGTTTHNGARVRITMELVKASEDRVVWTRQYEGKANEFIGLINKIAQDITQRFQLKPSQSLAVKSNQMPTDNPEAYNEYLQGKQLLATRAKEKLLASITKFDKAIALDSNFSDAYACKASAYFSLGNLNHIDLDSSFRMTEREVLKSIRLDADNAQAYGLLAAVYRDEYRWEQANSTFQIALRCNPSDAQVNYWYSLMLRSLGMLEEAVKYSSKAVALDPLSPVILGGHIRNCSYAHKKEMVQKSIDNGKLLFSDSFLFYWSTGYHYLETGDYAIALRELSQSRQLNPSVKGVEAAFVYTQSRLGQVSAAKMYLSSLPETPDNYTYFAMVYAGLNEKENCLRYLEKMATLGKTPTDVKVSPFFRFLHGDKRFDALLQRFGLLNVHLSN